MEKNKVFATLKSYAIITLGLILYANRNYGLAGFGRLAGSLGFVAGTQSQVAQGNLVWHGTGVEGLHVGVADDEVDTLDAAVVHVVDSVAAATTDAYDLDVRGLSFGRIKGKKSGICVFFHVLVSIYLFDKEVIN